MTTEPVRMVMVTTDPTVARRVGLSDGARIEIVRLVRRVEDLATTVDGTKPAVVAVDTGLDDDAAFAAIEETIGRNPRVRLLALTPEPAPHDHVVRALAAGALGFVDAAADDRQFAAAANAVAAGRAFVPSESTRSMLAATADDLGLTAAERDARLRNLVIGLIPLAGGLTAVMSLLWRRYLGQIGVRPVDVAIDPATRLVDAFFALSVLLSIIGPLVAILLLAKVFDLDDDLPSMLRITRWQPGRALAVGAPSASAHVVAATMGPVGLVDPCNDDTVELVSVGSHRLVVIDTVTCVP